MDLQVINPYQIIKTLEAEIEALRAENEALKEKVGDTSDIVENTDNG